MDNHELLGALAESLCRLTADAWEHPEPVRTAPSGGAEPIRVKAGANGFGQLLSAFTGAGYALADLGVVEITVQNGRGSSWRYMVDGTAAMEVVAKRSRSGAYDTSAFEKAAVAWVECATHFDLIDTRRVPFIPDADMVPVMRAFASRGYARTFEQQFLWTDAIGLVMRHAGEWTDENLSHVEVHERETDIDLALAMATVPDDVREAAFAGNVLEVQDALCNRWQDGAWRPRSQSADPYSSLYGGIERAHRFVQMIVDGDKPSSTQ